MTPAAFLQSYPEFFETSPTLVNAKLQMAAARMGGPDNAVWPAFATTGQLMTISDVAHGALAAHYLAISPFGTEMRLKPRAGSGDEVRTTYWTVWQECCDIVAGGFVVAGGDCIPPTTGGLSAVTTGVGTAAVVNGSATVTFNSLVTFPAGTMFVFYSQPGVFYSLNANMVGTNIGTLSAAYGGTSAPATVWGYELP